MRVRTIQWTTVVALLFIGYAGVVAQAEDVSIPSKRYLAKEEIAKGIRAVGVQVSGWVHEVCQ